MNTHPWEHQRWRGVDEARVEALELVRTLEQDRLDFEERMTLDFNPGGPAWICSCGRWFLDDADARAHIHQPEYDPAVSRQWGGET